MQEQNWIMGLWKFSDKISTKDLGEVAQKWAAEDSNYLQLYIRKVSKDQMGIGFTYTLPNLKDSQEEYEDYKNKYSDSLKRMFGNDLVGWDFGSKVWVIKDCNMSEKQKEKKMATIINTDYSKPRNEAI